MQILKLEILRWEINSNTVKLMIINQENNFIWEGGAFPVTWESWDEV